MNSQIAARAAGTLTMLAAVFGLASCSPAPRSLVAVRAVDGKPVALLAGCPDFQIDEIYIFADDHGVTPSPEGPYRWLQRTGSTVPDSMPLFGEVPAGWTVAHDRLGPGRIGEHYDLLANAGSFSTLFIEFTLQDLADLAPDEVLVGKDPGSHKRVTEKRFREQARDEC